MNTTAQNLADYKWKNRLVFLVDTTTETKAIQNQLALFAHKKVEMADRDLILFLVSEATVVDEAQNEVAISIEKLRKVARIESDFKGVLLFGKDGGCKLKKEFQVEPKELFDLIDGMPMRLSEIKNKQWNQSSCKSEFYFPY